MNVFNRIVVILLLLILIAVAVFAIITPYTPVVGNFVRNLPYVGPYVGTSIWLYVLVGAIVVILLALILLILQLRPRQTRLIRIHNVNGGEAYLQTESIANRVAFNVAKLADVTKVQPHVHARGHSVDVITDVETTPHIQVPMKTDEILAVIRDQVEGQMGLRLRTARVHIRSGAFPKEPQYAREAAQAWTPAPPPPAPMTPPPALPSDESTPPASQP